jgi:hypothetical protein
MFIPDWAESELRFRSRYSSDDFEAVKEMQKRTPIQPQPDKIAQELSKELPVVQKPMVRRGRKPKGIK